MRLKNMFLKNALLYLSDVNVWKAEEQGNSQTRVSIKHFSTYIFENV